MAAAIRLPQLWNRYSYVTNNPINTYDPTGAYQEDVHRDLTTVLAEAVGFSDDMASIIGNANQDIDENPYTEPFCCDKAREMYHFTTEERRNTLWASFQKSGSLRTLGTFLHAQQDAFSHQGFNWAQGHAHAGVKPDLTSTTPSKSLKMAFITYQKLTEAAKRSGVSMANRVAWGKIEKGVIKFVNAKSEKKKREAIDEIRRTIKGIRQQ